MTMPGESIPILPEMGPEAEFGVVLMAARERLLEAVSRQNMTPGIGFVVVRNHFETSEPIATYVLSEREYDFTQPQNSGEQFAVSVPIPDQALPHPQPGLERSQEFFVIGPPDDLNRRAIVNRETYAKLFLGRKPLVRDLKDKLPKRGGYKVTPIRWFE